MSKTKNRAIVPSGLIRILWPVLLLVGILLRLVVFFQNRSLFLDEANLGRNIAEISLAGCFQPLAYQQYAPPLFLVLEKINWLLVGASEYALRFWPLIMGCLCLYLLYRLLKDQFGDGLSGLFVFYLFSFSQVYIRYSTELKQYSTDMAVSTLLIWAAVTFPITSKKRLIGWMLGGSLAIWLSMPSVFILAGVGAFFLFSGTVKQFVPVIHILLSGAVWLLSFGIYYQLILSNDLQKTELLSYHQPFFWPLIPLNAADWQQLLTISQSLLGTLIGHTFPAILTGLLGLSAGLFYLWKDEKHYLWLVLFPVVLCLFASGLGYYSLMERLSLFMMPALGLLLAKGLHGLENDLGRKVSLLLFFLYICVLPLRKGGEYLFASFRYEEMRPLLRDLDTSVAPSDLIWVDQYAVPAFIWYTQYAPVLSTAPESPSLVFNSWNGEVLRDLPEGRQPDGRLWFIFSHLVSELNRAEMEQDLKILNEHFGPPDVVHRYPGAELYGWE